MATEVTCKPSVAHTASFIPYPLKDPTMRLKCVNCGFVNFPQETSCKRCKSALGQAFECHNIWRDGKRLVISMSEHLLPKRCLKCGTADYVDRQVLELTYTPLSAYFTILLNFTYWTNIELHGFFCTSHRRFAERQPFLLLPNFLIVAGGFQRIRKFAGRQSRPQNAAVFRRWRNVRARYLFYKTRLTVHQNREAE